MTKQHHDIMMRPITTTHPFASYIWTKTFSRGQNISRNFKQDITFGKSTPAEIPGGYMQCLLRLPQTSATMGIGDTATQVRR